MLSRLIQFSLAQRFLVLAATLVVAAAGVIAWQSLTLDAVPDITTNQVVVNTETPGMGPAEVERLVTFPIETAMSGLPDVEGVRSLSMYGLSQVTVTFADAVDTYFARQLVNERLGSVGEQLPNGVPAPQLGPVSTGLGDIFQYAVESDRRSAMELRTLQDWLIRPQIRTVPGVVETNAAGGYEKQYEVQVDPRKLLARGVTLDQVVEALEANNENAGGGFIEHGGEQMVVRGVGIATSAEDLASIMIDVEHGVPVHIHDVAEVRVGSAPRTGLATKDGKEAVVAIAQMLKGANGRTVSMAVAERLKEVREQLPDDVKLTPVYDRSELVNRTVRTVQVSLLEGGLLVVAVLLLLLGNARGALIVALAVPLSMLMAVIGMNRFGISGNLMSLGAIDFGLIVDGTVVMVENAVRRVAEAREHKGSTLTRAEVAQHVRHAAHEVARPVAFAVAIITVVYLPILALEGTEGKMFRPMAYTVVFALIGALALSLTAVPALCSLLLSGDTREARNPILAAAARAYAVVLDAALRHRAAVAGGAAALVALSLLIFGGIGREFIPQLDEGSIVVQPIRLRTADTSETVRLVTAAEKAILTVPEVTTVFSRSGTPEVATDPMPMSLTDTFVMLKPRSAWRPGVTKADLLDDLGRKLAEVPGQAYAFSQPIEMRFSELVAGVKADVGIKVFGDDLDVLLRQANAVADAVRDIPGAEDVGVEQVDDVPVLEIRIDREAIARVGVNVADIQQWIGTALGGAAVGQVMEGDRRFDITVRLPEAMRNDVTAIGNLPIATPAGGAVPLESLARIQTVMAPAQISRENGKRRIVVQVNVRDRDLGGFVQEARAAVRRDVQLADGTWLEWGGQFENLEKAQRRLAVAVPAALALIFALLFTAFGSVRQALIVFSGVPLAVTGGVAALWLRGMPFSISAGVGFIALSGVAVLNGVVMVAATNRLRDRYPDMLGAVREGALTRLRPVLMTALVAALGFVPMAIATGEGAEVQRPLATVVIGGIVSSTLLTLVVLPVLYAWFGERAGREGKASPDSAGAPA